MTHAVFCPPPLPAEGLMQSSADVWVMNWVRELDRYVMAMAANQVAALEDDKPLLPKSLDPGAVWGFPTDGFLDTMIIVIIIRIRIRMPYD